MADWEIEQILPLHGKGKLKNKWDDEDTVEDDVKELWEDDDDDSAMAPTLEPPAEKSTKNVSKAGDKKAQTAVVAKEAPMDPLIQKLQQQRITEEVNPNSTIGLFAENGDEKSLDNFIPKTESHFLEYANLITSPRSYYYIGLLKAVTRLSMLVLKSADAKDIASAVTAVSNEKLKAEKEADGLKWKTGSKKKKLHVDKPEDDAHLNGYNAADGYDLM